MPARNPERRTDRTSEPRAKAINAPALPDAARVLALTTAHDHWDSLMPAVADSAGSIAEARDAERAVAMASGAEFDVALVDADFAGGISIIADLQRVQPALACIIVAGEPTVELTVAAMRLGAVDLITAGAGPRAVSEAVALAAAGARHRRNADRRVRRRVTKLRHLLRESGRSRDELMKQMDSLCRGMAGSCRDLSDQMRHIAMASELNAILRQDLELESLLRTVLEYVLRKIGPTNAAIFLPASTGDYSLGAYINYDCPRDTAESMLDHLTDVIAPAYESTEGITVLRTPEEVATLGSAAHWLQDSSVALFSCRQDGECLAVVALFRDRRNPFTEPLVAMLRIIGDLFSRQLARVVSTHHRHLPKHKWGGAGDPTGEPRRDDDIDLAA